MKGRGSFVLAALLGLLAWSGEAHAEPIDPPGAAATDAPGGPAAAPTPAPLKHEDDEGEGLLGPISIGGFVGAGFPRPLSVEGFAKIEKVLGLGLEYSVMPKLSFSGTETKFYAIAADVRVFPLQDGFFIGLGVGRQHLDASGSVALPAPLPSIPESITGDTWFVNPRFGFLTTFGWGGTIGIDAGVQIPINATFNSTLPNGIAMSQDINDVAHFFTKSALPTVNLLRLGMML